MELEELPEALRSQAAILGGEPAWPASSACAVVQFMRDHASAVVGVELWAAESGGPRVLGWSEYNVKFTGDWAAYVNENAEHALAELAKAVPADALFNLTWISSEDELWAIRAAGRPSA